jgi:hypothetical protein
VEPDTLPSWYAGAEQRIPLSLDDLHGPETGVVWLPNRLAWSGPSDFDVADAGQRLTLYTLLLDCGQRADVCTYMHPDLLVRDWPDICRLTARELCAKWERRLPALQAAA